MLDLFFIAFEDCFHLGFLTYLGFVGVVQGFDTLRQARMNELQVAEHKAAYVHAQLQSLKLQLQPHFLFNTLHAIGSLMHYDVPTADRMLSRLSEMLRTSLRESDNPVVTLKQEMAFIEAYIDIEKIRFEQRLAVQWVIPDDLLGSAIPPFILQPLVENAIKYGVAPRADGGMIVIRAYADKASLMLEVEDDAPSPVGAAEGFRYRLEQHAPAPGRAVWRGTEFRAGAPCRGHGRAHPHSPSDAGGGMSGTIRVLVADDETSARKRLIQFLGAHADVALAEARRATAWKRASRSRACSRTWCSSMWKCRN
ncbi:histidine kinase [Massilia sp. B-10]|nr:histidine kinase [Massilia sp. B-10]